jgi:hypothetical protein
MTRIAPLIVLVLAIYVLCWAGVYPDALMKFMAGDTFTALASGRSLAKAEVDPEYRFLIYQPKSTDIPMPVPVQQETQQTPPKSQQGEAQQPQQGAQQEQAQPPAREGEQQQYREQAPEQQPAQPEPERTYGWGYAWWWWIVIAAIIIFFIIIFAAWGGWGGRGGP